MTLWRVKVYIFFFVVNHSTELTRVHSLTHHYSGGSHIKVVVLTVSPAGEKTIEATYHEAHINRLGANLVAPVETFPEASECIHPVCVAVRVQFVLMNLISHQNALDIVFLETRIFTCS